MGKINNDLNGAKTKTMDSSLERYLKSREMNNTK